MSDRDRFEEHVTTAINDQRKVSLGLVREISGMKSEIEALKGTCVQLNQIVRDGNGKPPLVVSVDRLNGEHRSLKSRVGKMEDSSLARGNAKIAASGSVRAAIVTAIVTLFSVIVAAIVSMLPKGPG